MTDTVTSRMTDTGLSNLTDRGPSTMTDAETRFTDAGGSRPAITRSEPSCGVGAN